MSAKKVLSGRPAPVDVVKMLGRNGPQPPIVDPDAIESEKAGVEAVAEAVAPAEATRRSEEAVSALASDRSARVVRPADDTHASNLARSAPDTNGERPTAASITVAPDVRRPVGRPRAIREKKLLTGAVDFDVYAFVDDRWTTLRDARGLRVYRDRGEYMNAIFRAVRTHEDAIMNLVNRGEQGAR